MAEQDTSSGERDWGNLRFTPRRGRYAEGNPEDNADSRFVIGVVVFVAVVLLYPWYSYWVHSKLLERDLRQAAEAVGAQFKQETEAVNARMQRDAARKQANTARQRIAGVRVMGAMITNGVPVVVVDMGQAGLAESAGAICTQASARLGRPTSGMTLQVQSHRGRLPAVTIGSVGC
jgi:hypothetical protein